LAATVLAALAACGTAPTTDPDPGPDPEPTAAEFGTATWNDATWQ
jgi:hypothetical protein